MFEEPIVLDSNFNSSFKNKINQLFKLSKTDNLYSIYTF